MHQGGGTVAVRNAMKSDDSGFTLVEVIIAMMIFAIVSMGVAYSTVTALKVTADTASRETATNLASADIDAVRAIGDPFKVFSSTKSTTVGKTTYTVKRDVVWWTGPSSLEGCGVGASNLQYKRVNVAVSWTGSLTPTTAVYADTVLAPETRLNNPSYGSIFISAVGADGTGRSGVTPTISGSSSLPGQPDPTDADGCSYVFSVPAGTYTVTAKRPGFVDTTQSTTSTFTVSVKAGGSATAPFQLDQAVNYSVAAPEGTILPAAMDVTYYNSYGTYVSSAASTALHPFTSGYAAIAGKLAATGWATSPVVICKSVDPATWPAKSVNGKNLAAGTRTASTVAGLPGGSVSSTPATGFLTTTAINTKMRIVSVDSPSAATVGDPMCATKPATPYEYTVPKADVVLAVPFGSWRLEEYNGTKWSTVPTSRYNVISNAAGNIFNGDIMTVDPRMVAG
jgi:prepilin-type N-terminal cleavage/methylation domain-containing protein